MKRHLLQLSLLALSAGLLSAQTSPAPPSVAGNANIRVQAQTINGHLQEQYQARAGAQWITVAVSAGRTEGALTVRDANGAAVPGTLRGVSVDHNALVEHFTAGSIEITRTIDFSQGPNWAHVVTHIAPNGTATLHSVADTFRFQSQPDWSYSPSVGGFNPDAQYKAPLILTQTGQRAFGIVPDLSALTPDLIRRCAHSLDLDVPAGPLLSAGFIPARRYFHAVFTQDLDRAWTATDPFVNSYYLLITAAAPPGEAFRQAVRWHWQKFGRPLQGVAASQQTGTFPGYASLGNWDDWRKQVWDRESTEQWLPVPLPEGAPGGAVRTLRWDQPNPSVYMSSWFNSVRTAVGMALYARRNAKPDLLNLAAGTIRLALAAPGPDGAFKCIAVPKNGSVVWAAGDGAGESVKSGFLGFDMSWTAYWLLKWRHAGLPGSDAILPRCRRLAGFFLARQLPDGMLPTRFDESGAPQPQLSRMLMAETAPVALFLLELHAADPNPRYLSAALRALGFLERDVIPQRKWYDYETFFSCSPRAISFDQRTAQWPANNLALIPAAAAFLAAHQATGKAELLARGEALLDYLLLFQQSWTNPVLEGLTGPAMLLGGFTTQNSDAEWSDARQSQAGNVLLDYYRATGKAEYLERGIAALRAQFPISPSENWAHSGYGKKAGVSSFHWGTGSGMAGIELEEDFLHDAIVDLPSSRATGVNGLDIAECTVTPAQIRIKLTTPYPWKRQPRLVVRGANPGQQFQLLVNGADLGTHAAKSLETGVPVAVP